jgi:hypothetical protein
VPDEPVLDDAAGLRAANARLRAVVEAKDGQVAMLTAALEAALEREQRLGLRLATRRHQLTPTHGREWTPGQAEHLARFEKRMRGSLKVLGLPLHVTGVHLIPEAFVPLHAIHRVPDDPRMPTPLDRRRLARVLTGTVGALLVGLRTVVRAVALLKDCGLKHKLSS